MQSDQFMTYGYTHAGVEWRERYLWTDTVSRPTSMDILLYDDRTDRLSADDDLEDITTEPDDGLYQRASVSIGGDFTIETPTVEEGEDPEGQAVVAQMGDVVFDLSSTTGEVDSWGAVLECELAGDSAPREHLIVRVPLVDRVDLGEWDGERELAGPAFESRPNL